MNTGPDLPVVAGGLPFPVLDAFLGASSVEFFQTEWQRATRHFPSAAAAQRLGAAGIDFRQAVSDALAASKLEVLGGKGRPGPAPGTPGWPETADAPSARVSRVQDYVPALSSFCRAVSDELSHRVSVNLYVSPPQSRGLDRHVDGHDVLILQIEGRKRWKVWRNDAPPPLDALPALTFEGSKRLRSDYRGTPFGGRSVADAELSEGPVEDFFASPGDLFYVPRGWAHDVWTEDSYSAHLTFGLHLVSWVDLLMTVVAQSSRRHGAIRGALPMGFARISPDPQRIAARTKELLALLADTDGAEAMEEVIGRWMCRDLTSLSGEGEVQTPPSAAPEMRLRRVGPVALVHRAESVGLFRPAQTGAEAWFPLAFSKALRFIATTEPPEFAVGDVPGVSPSGRVRLCQLLLAQGYVQPLAS